MDTYTYHTAVDMKTNLGKPAGSDRIANEGIPNYPKTFITFNNDNLCNVLYIFI